MKIPVYSSTIRRKEMDAVLTCMVSERIGPGEINTKLTSMTKELFGFEAALALRSPALALKYALKAIDLPNDSAVIISALAPSWYYRVLPELGYKVLIADVHPESAQISTTAVEEAIHNGGRLLILNHALGFMPDPAPYAAFGIPIIEDISQSAGAQIDEKKAGHSFVFSILGLEERDIITAGGGALLVTAGKRESVVLKKFTEEAPLIDILPDINSALAYVQLKEYARNSALRREISSTYMRSLLQGRHKSFIETSEGASTNYSFPVVLSSGLKEVRQYVSKKNIDIEAAFAGSVAEYLGDTLETCIQAKSLLLRCVLFPLYPRLGTSNAVKIAKVLATLP